MAERERYLPSVDQLALAETMGDALEALLPIARLHETAHESEATWRALAELGVFSMTRPEDQGGAGLGVVEEALVAFELGRRLASPAVFATLSVGPHGDFDQGGAVAAAWAEGRDWVMVDEPFAQRVLIRDGGKMALIDRPLHRDILDDVHWAARLIRIEPANAVPIAIDRAAAARFSLIGAAAMAGLATTALDMAVAYAGFREQFGRPIGSFQAVKHHCANMGLAARSARDLVLFAAVALAEASEEGVALTDSAVLIAGSAAERNAALNVQIHGGVGFSDEADPHLLVKRARVLLSLSGGLDAAIQRVTAPEAAA